MEHRHMALIWYTLRGKWQFRWRISVCACWSVFRMVALSPRLLLVSFRKHFPQSCENTVSFGRVFEILNEPGVWKSSAVK